MNKKTIYRVVRKAGEFASIHKAHFSDSRLGVGAIGTLDWLLSKPDDWKPQISHIASSTGSSLGEIRSAMKRLEQCGYMRRSPVRDMRSGRIIRWEVVVFETPQAAQQAQDEQPGLFESFIPKKETQKSKPVTETRQKPHFQQNTPQVDLPGGGFPECGDPCNGYPHDGKRTLLITNVTKNEFTKQRRTNSADSLPEADRLPAGAGGPAADVATPDSFDQAGAESDRSSVVVESDSSFVSLKSVQSLMTSQAYFPHGEASRLLSDHGPEKCLKAMQCLQDALDRAKQGGRVVENHRGLVVRALMEGWEPRGKPVVKRPATAPSKPPDASEAQAMEERRKIDLVLSALPDEQWKAIVAVLSPTFGMRIQAMLKDGRDPKTIQTVRFAVFHHLNPETPHANNTAA